MCFHWMQESNKKKKPNWIFPISSSLEILADKDNLTEVWYFKTGHYCYENNA